MAIPTILGLLLSSLLLHAAEGDCPGERPTKNLVCYVDAIPEEFDPCLCTHLVLNTPLDKLSPQHEVVQSALRIQGRNPELRLVARLSGGAEVALRRRGALAHTVAGVVHKLGLDGVEVDLQWGKEVAAKVQLVDFVQALSKELAQEDSKERTKRSYKIHEDIVDDVVTPRWTLQSNSRTNRRKTREAEEKTASTTEDLEVTTEKEEKKEKEVKEDKEDEEEKDTTTATVSERSSQQEIEEEEEPKEDGKLIILHLTSEPQHLAKNFDLKRLSKYVSFYTLASDNLTDSSEAGLAYHPSRLMGIEDILNADSLIDLVTGLGAPHEKLVLTLPAAAFRFTLQDKEKNMAQSPVTGPPSKISRAELCKLMSQGEWTVERDEDLTAPYAFHENTWVAFDDPTSVSIKGKYVILRDLAGAAVSSADSEDWSSKCNSSARGASLLTTLHDTFTHVARKSRAAQLVDLQEQLHSAGHFSYSGDIHLSPYRIVRVVDRAGNINVVRKEAKTEFECSRQGYFRHPSGCNRFYRCVKFNQYSPDFTVFEYDCPAGLAFDETVEVCVWPGSLADGGACQGSSEIAPVPRQRYVCPTTAGYYADPENCRWFFACLDHHGDGSPLTAYEFRCPFGLVFDEQALVCNWPWLVPGCGGSGVYSARFTVGDFFEGRHRPSYASVSDYHVSGGRIDNVPGGVVLGSALSGIGSGAYLGSYASGNNVLGSGSVGAYDSSSHAGSLGAGGTYSSAGPGLGYVSGLPAGSLASGSYQSNSVSGSGSAYNAGSGTTYSGTSGASGTKYASGLGSGSYVAGGVSSGSAYTGGAGYSGGVGGTSGYSAGEGAYSGGAGIDSGSYVAGGAGAGSAYSGGAGYSGGVGGTSGFGSASGYSAGVGSYSGGAGIDSGAYVSGGVGPGSAYGTTGKYSGSGAYSGGAKDVFTSGAGAGAGYKGSGKYSASYSGAAGFGGNTYSGGSGSSYSSSTKYGGANAYTGSYGNGAYGTYGGGAYYDQSGAYVEDNSGSYIHDNSGDYFHDGAGDSGGLYTGKESYGGQYTGGYIAGGAYVPGVYGNGAYQGSHSSGGQYMGSYVGGGEYSGSYDTGAYRGEGSTGGKYKGEYDAGSFSGKYDTSGYSGKYDAGSYSGKYDTSGYSGKYDSGSYAGKYDTSGYSGKYDAGSYSGKYDGGAYSGKFDGGAYSGKYDGGSYTGVSDSDGYQGGSTSYQGGYKVNTAPGTVVTSGERHEYNSVNIAEHQPAIGLVGLDAVKVSGGDIHSGGYVSSYVTPGPIPAVSVTPVVSSYSTVTPAPISVSTYKPSTVQPTTPRPVTYYPVPSSPVTPVSTKTLISYSTIKPPAYVANYEQPSYVKTVTPAPPVVSYSTPTIGVVKTPVVPLNPVTYTYKQPVVKNEYVSTGFQYSSPAPVGVSYEQPSYIRPVTPAPYYQKEFVDYGYKKPIPPAYLPPLPSYSYEYKPPATYVKPVEVKYSYPKPAVLKTPIIPLNPIQYSTPSPIGYSVAPLKPISYAPPAPVAYPSYPTPAPVSYSGPQYLPPVEPVKPITYTTPAPAVSYKYSAPAVKYTPTVLKTPVVPLNPVQYSTPAPIHFEYSTPSPINTYSYSTPSPPVSYTPAPVKPLKPISYTTPAPPVSYEYSTPRPIQPVRPLKPISYSTPAPFVQYNVPTVLKTPVVPLNPIQYTTPAPIRFEYSTPAPPKPVSFVSPVTYSTPGPAFSYEYSTPAPVQPVGYAKPVRPITYSTPAPPAPQYEYKYSTPAPIEPVSYSKPLRPVAPAITYYSTPAPPPAKLDVTYYSTPAPPPVKPISYEYSSVPLQPVNYAKPLRPVSYSTPAPVINYEYSRPTVTPTVLKTPVVPLNPIQYTTPAPIHFQYSTPAPYPRKPVTYTAPDPQVNYEYLPPAPVKPLKPISYSAPNYLPPVPVEPLKPLKPITYTTPSPAVTYEYSYPVVKPVVPAVLKTPVVPLNPIQYTTPAPIYFEHSTPAPVKPYKPVVYSTPAPAVSYEYLPPAPVRTLKPIVYSTPAPPVSYEYLPPAPVQPVKPITLSSPAPFSYGYKYQPVKQVPAVLKTPVVPLNPIQYTTPAHAIVQYSTPAPTVSYVKPLKPVVYSTPTPPTISYEYSTPAPPSLATYGYKSTAYVKPVPTVLKTPIVPLNPVQYSTPAPIVNQYSFGVAYQNPEIQYGPEVTYKQQGYISTKVVKDGYDYPKPAVRFEEAPKIVSTTPAPAVTYTYEAPETTPIYKQVYNYVKTPVVSAYEKVLNAISYSTTPAPLPVQPVTQSPVSYAPVNVGPSYSRPALVKTPSIPVTPVTGVPEYHKVLNVVKATTTPSPLYVNHYASTYEPEIIPVSTPKPIVYKKKPTVVTETSYVKDYSYEENIDDIYDAVKSDFGTKLAGGYEEGYIYNQQRVEIPEVKVYTSTTPAPVPVFKETYKVRKPVKTFVTTYEQPSVAVGFEAGSYEGGSSYSTTGAPAIFSSSEAAFGEQYHKETSFSGYKGVDGDSITYEELDQAIPAVPAYTSTTKAPTVKVTTARVSLPVVTSPRPEGGYYVRKQKVRVRPVVTTENYPDVYSSTYTPSTVSTTTFAPTYSYSTTPAPFVTSTTVHPDDVVDVQEGEEEDGVKILEGYGGQYGGFVKEGYVSSTVASIEDGEAVVGILKKGRITYNGRRTKTKVVVVSKLSDFNPLLVGKLGAECSCDGKSNTVTVRRNKQRGSNKLFTPSRDSTVPDQQYLDTYQTSTTTAAPIVVKSESSYESSGYESSSYNSPVVEIKPIRKKTRFYSTTTGAPEYSEEEVASQANYVPAGVERVKDRIECKRAGLFRHPNKCNKFYSCDWDQWKKKFTVHEFKCPIHLAYDINLGACNWPSKGPACAGDNLLV